MVYMTKKCWEISTVKGSELAREKKTNSRGMCPAVRGRAGG